MVRMSTYSSHGEKFMNVRTQLYCSLSSVTTNEAHEPETSQPGNARIQQIRSTMATRVRIKCDWVIVPVLHATHVLETRPDGIVRRGLRQCRLVGRRHILFVCGRFIRP